MVWSHENTDAEIIDLRAQLFAGLGHSTRLQIVQVIVEADDSLHVSDISDQTGIPLQLASYHLQRLQQCGLVTTDQQGRHVYYQCSSPVVGDLLRLADECIRQDLEEALGYQVTFASEDG